MARKMVCDNVRSDNLDCAKAVGLMVVRVGPSCLHRLPFAPPVPPSPSPRPLPPCFTLTGPLLLPPPSPPPFQPENMLLDAHKNLKVSDFGLSALPQQARADGMLRTACGTPNYVAPEIIRGRGYDGSKADVWSCGVILFVLLAGHVPFEERELPALYARIQRAEFTYPKWFSPQVRWWWC